MNWRKCLAFVLLIVVFLEKNTVAKAEEFSGENQFFGNENSSNSNSSNEANENLLVALKNMVKKRGAETGVI